MRRCDPSVYDSPFAVRVYCCTVEAGSSIMSHLHRTIYTSFDERSLIRPLATACDRQTKAEVCLCFLALAWL